MQNMSNIVMPEEISHISNLSSKALVNVKTNQDNFINEDDINVIPPV